MDPSQQNSNTLPVLAQLPLMNPTSTRDKAYLADDLALNPAKRPKLPLTIPKGPKSNKNLSPKPEFNEVLSERYIHAATCGFDFRPYTPYLPTRKYPAVTIQNLIDRRRKERDHNLVLNISESNSTVGDLPFVATTSLPSTRAVPNEDGSLRAVSATGVSKFLYKDTLAYFRSFGKMATIEYAATEADVLHVVYETKEAADSILSSKVPSSLTRFGVNVRKTDVENANRLLNIHEPILPMKVSTHSAPLGNSVLTPLKVLSDPKNFLAPDLD